MRIRFAIAALALGATTLAALPADARINQRQNHQQHRIARGINTGSLTAREAVGLERQQARIARVEARNRADGNGLNRAERLRIERMQDRASRSIYRQRHDAQGN